MKRAPKKDYRHLNHEHYHYHYGLLHRSELFVVEIIMAALVVLSLFTLLFSYIMSPTPEQLSTLLLADTIIGGLLLVEFFGRFLLARHKRRYLQHNWWYLLAAIPVATPLATLLRALRLLGFVKMIKIGIHLKEDAELLEEIDDQEN